MTARDRRANLRALTIERPNQRLLVARRSNLLQTSVGKRGTKGNPVKIRCGRATVIGETRFLRHPAGKDVDENHCPPQRMGR